MKKRTIYILFGILLLINTGMFFYFNGGRQKIYYVDLQKLYAEFELKKELEIEDHKHEYYKTEDINIEDSTLKIIEQKKTACEYYTIEDNTNECNKIEDHNMKIKIELDNMKVI